MQNDIDEEPSQPDQGSFENTKKKTAYQTLKRELTEEDLNSAGALKLMLNDIDRLNDEISKNSSYLERFHEKDKNCAVLDSKLHTNTSKEILYSITLTLGAALIGICPSIWALSTLYGVLILVFGMILILFGLISKFR